MAMAAGSSDAQYLPSRYSSTNTGTFAPTFTLRTRSLRTTLPAKAAFAFRSSSSCTSCDGATGSADVMSEGKVILQFLPGNGLAVGHVGELQLELPLATHGVVELQENSA